MRKKGSNEEERFYLGGKVLLRRKGSNEEERF
jgi:hypothetical protein